MLFFNSNLEFLPINNESMICYTKHSDDYSDIILIVVNLDTNWPQSGFIEIPLKKYGLPESKSFQVHDLLDDKRYLWHGQRVFVKLEPSISPAHIFKIRRFERSERNFDYYL